MKCLRCHTPMLVTHKKGIEIDYCPHCQGVWLDKGELEKIIEQIGEHYSNKRNYEADYDNYNYGDKDFYIHHPHRKKQSFVTHFFEFDCENRIKSP